MSSSRIVDCGDVPKIEGSRITVYAIFEYASKGRSREWIASMLQLSSPQVQAALDYIDEHRAEIACELTKIQERIERGNPPDVEDRLKQSQQKLRDKLSQQEVASDPRFLKRIENARTSLRSGRGVKLDDVDIPKKRQAKR